MGEKSTQNWLFSTCPVQRIGRKLCPFFRLANFNIAFWRPHRLQLVFQLLHCSKEIIASMWTCYHKQLALDFSHRSFNVSFSLYRWLNYQDFYASMQVHPEFVLRNPPCLLLRITCTGKVTYYIGHRSFAVFLGDHQSSHTVLMWNVQRWCINSDFNPYSGVELWPWTFPTVVNTNL